jgi:hypothetical protein
MEQQLSLLEKKYQLPNGLLNAVMMAESAGDPNAVSPAGAQGLFQFMPDTAKAYEIDPFDPNQAAEGAARMYSDLSKQFDGDLHKMLAAYNWGSGNVERKGMDRMPEETRNYIPKVMNAMPKEEGLSPEDIKALEAEFGGQEEFSLSDEDIAALQTEFGEENSGMDRVKAGSRTAMQGLTFGAGDEIQAAIGTLPVYALKNMFTDDKVTLSQAYDALLGMSREELEKARKDYPVQSFATEIAGAIPTGAGAATQLSKVGKLAKYVRPTTWRGAAATGTVSGAAYGFNSSSEGLQERLKGGAIGGVAGGALSPVSVALARGGKGAVQGARNLLSKSSGEAVEQTSKQIDNLPMASSNGDTVRMPTGAATGNVKMMRAEEAARQGLLGDEHQAMISQVDDLFKTDVKQAVKVLSGGVDNSEDILADGINKFKRRADAEKRLASGLIKSRNDKIVKAQVQRDYVKDTLIKDVEELALDPNNRPFFSTSSSNDLKERMAYLYQTVGKKKDNIDFVDLAGWRADVGAYARSKAGQQEGVIANQVAKQYDNWLDGMSREALKGGDDDLVETIFNANKKYAQFKSKYGTNRLSGQSKIVEDIINKDELTQTQLVNLAFGKNLKGKDATGQVVKRMLFAVPKGSKRSAMQSDFRGGLIMRAFEGAETPNGFKLSKLRNELNNVRKSEAYKNYLSEPEFDTALNGLIKDIDKYADATTRRDVYSPSGPLILRAVDGLLSAGGFISSPLGGRMLTEPMKGMVKQGKMAPDRRLVEKSLQSLSKKLIKDHSKAHFYGAVGSAPASNQIIEKIKE